jgi:peroxiredoxin
MNDANKENLTRQQKVDILSLNRLRVLDENKNEILFKSFLDQESITIVFVRHFGCIACRAHIDQIWNVFRKTKNYKARIVFIGSGSPYVIKAFKEDMGVQEAEIYTDPSLETVDACGMKRGVLNLVNFKTVSSMRALRSKGYRQGSFKDSGTHRQMGGVVVFKKPGLVTYHYISEYLGDIDDPEDWST